jgi:hypothetical protein
MIHRAFAFWNTTPELRGDVLIERYISNTQADILTVPYSHQLQLLFSRSRMSIAFAWLNSHHYDQPGVAEFEAVGTR